jgi:hypothetical protein
MIVVTNQAVAICRRMSANLDAAHYLMKPLHSETLVRCMQSVFAAEPRIEANSGAAYAG